MWNFDTGRLVSIIVQRIPRSVVARMTRCESVASRRCKGFSGGQSNRNATLLGVLGGDMSDTKKQSDRSLPPAKCEGCGSENVKSTYKKGVLWRFYCQECGHWDEEWLEKNPEKG